MRRIPGFPLALTAVLALLLAGAALAYGEPFSLTLLHTNDIHAHLLPFDAYGASCDKDKDAAGQCVGGAARLRTAVDRERAGGGNVLLLDAGDQFQGTVFFSKYQGQASSFFMNRLGYDAMAVGNHEFDEGPAVLANFFAANRFPTVAANLDVAASPELKDKVAPYVVRDFGGTKVGIIGVANQHTPEISSPGPDVAFTPPAKAVAKAVSALHKQGVRIIIALSHAGLAADKKLAARVAGIDVIVGGHSHVLLANDNPEAVGPCPLPVTGPDGGTTLIVTAGYWGKYLGVLHADFDAAGRVVAASGNPVRLDAAVPEDPATNADLDRFAEALKPFEKTVVGNLTPAMAPGACRTGECLPGDLAAEAMLAATAKLGAVAALFNGGGVRAGFDAGEVTLGNIMTVYPFANTTVVVTLTGEDLLAALENGLVHSDAREGSGRFLQVAGLTYVFDPGRLSGSRVVSAAVRGPGGTFAPVAKNASYRVAINSFMYRGGDGYAVFAARGKDMVDTETLTADTVAAYIKARSPLAMALDGRIKNVAVP